MCVCCMNVQLRLTATGGDVVHEVIALDPVNRNSGVEGVVTTLRSRFVGWFCAPVAVHSD